MQGHVAVVVEFADGDPQPVRVADLCDRVGFEVAEFTDSHPGAGEQSDARRQWIRFVVRAARMNSTKSPSSRNRGRASSALGTSPKKIGTRAGASVPAPLDDPDEEHAQHRRDVAGTWTI